MSPGAEAGRGLAGAGLREGAGAGGPTSTDLDGQVCRSAAGAQRLLVRSRCWGREGGSGVKGDSRVSVPEDVEEGMGHGLDVCP